MTIDIRSLTIRDALRGLEAKEFTTVDIVRDSLLRLDATDAQIEAWVEIKPRLAMETALYADRRRTFPQPTAPLFGIPLGIKDVIDLAGLRTRCNMESRVECDVAVGDAEVVRRLRQDGAIFFGKTVTQEAAAGVISDPARNPWDTDRIPGGSSGGSAAAVAAGTCLGALGTDTGGSIRIPASVTGLVGLKPTYGRLSLEGIFPLSPSLDTVGPIAKSVYDAALMYLSMAKRAKEIPALDERFPESGTSLQGKRIGVLSSYFLERVQPDVASAFHDAVAALRELGAEIVECDWADAGAARAVALIISRIESAAVHRDELRNAADLMGDALRSRLEIGALMPADTYLRARQVRKAIRASIAQVYREHNLDAIATPTLPSTAPRADDPFAVYEDGSREEIGVAFTRHTAPWNATGQPVISVPCGFDTDRMPIGLSLVGQPDAELELCDIAHAYERSVGWYRQVAPL